MQNKINHKPFDVFLFNLQNPTHAELPSTYYMACEDSLDIVFKSIENNLLVLSNDEKSEYLETLKHTLERLPNRDSTIQDLETYLVQYDIAYDELFRDEQDNELAQILDGNPYYVAKLKFDYSIIQKVFLKFWYAHHINLAIEKIEQLKKQHAFKPTSKSSYSVVEKLLIIRILQEANLFPKENQKLTAKKVASLIVALTGISSETEVKKNFPKADLFFDNKPITASQRREKLANAIKIQSLMTDLDSERINFKLNKMTNKLK